MNMTQLELRDNLNAWLKFKVGAECMWTRAGNYVDVLWLTYVIMDFMEYNGITNFQENTELFRHNHLEQTIGLIDKDICGSEAEVYTPFKCLDDFYEDIEKLKAKLEVLVTSHIIEDKSIS